MSTVSTFILTLIWDPSREMFSFNIPFLNRPILWYGFFFALAFLLGYRILIGVIKKTPELNPLEAKPIAEKLTLYAVVGAVIGARLGDLIFYQHFSYFLHHPFAVFKIWEGGLSSHGGSVGMLLAFAFFGWKYRKKWPQLSLIPLLDRIVISVALAASLIRIGNFFNQEILGTAASVPWAIVFLHPADGSAVISRHPVQLYESLFYFATFLLLWTLWHTKSKIRSVGRTSGLFLIIIFSFRFLIEFLKVPQSVYEGSDSAILMGQYLSLPFIFLGVGLIWHSNRRLKSGKRFLKE